MLAHIRRNYLGDMLWINSILVINKGSKNIENVFTRFPENVVHNVFSILASSLRY